jgi:hypothetical protein
MSTGSRPGRRRTQSASQDTKIAIQGGRTKVIEICRLWGGEVGKDVPPSRCLYPFFARRVQHALQARPRTNYTRRYALAARWKSRGKCIAVLQ